MTTYITHHPLSEDEVTSFNIMMAGIEWHELNPDRQKAINALCNKYPDISETALAQGSSTAPSLVPLSQRESIPEHLSDVPTDHVWDAFAKTEGHWKSGVDPEQFWKTPDIPTAQRSTRPTRPPTTPAHNHNHQRYSAPVSPSLSRRPPPMSPSITHTPSRLTRRGPAHSPSPVPIPPSPNFRRQLEPRQIPTLPPAQYRRPAPSDTDVDTYTLIMRRNDARRRLTAALHEAVDAEAEMDKLDARLRELDVTEKDKNGHQDEEAWSEDEEEEEQQQVQAKTKSAKRRERAQRQQQSRQTQGQYGANNEP
ncbi:hypothetical protein ACHAQK_009283 [Fusarium lateritium]